jgi:hypothetical protein
MVAANRGGEFVVLREPGAELEEHAPVHREKSLTAPLSRPAAPCRKAGATRGREQEGSSPGEDGLDGEATIDARRATHQAPSAAIAFMVRQIEGLEWFHFPFAHRKIPFPERT